MTLSDGILQRPRWRPRSIRWPARSTPAPSERISADRAFPRVRRITFRLVSHGQLLEPPAGDDRVAFITQCLEVDIVRGTHQVAHVATLGGHVGKIGAFVSDGLEIHISAILMAAVAGAFTLEAVVTLHAGECRFCRHDLMFDTPVHVGVYPFILAAVLHAGGFHAVHKGLLPVAVFPVGGLVRLVPGEQVGDEQVFVFGVNGLNACHDLEGRDFRVGIVDRSDGFGDIDFRLGQVQGISQEDPFHESAVPGIDRLGRLFPNEIALFPIVVGHAVLVFFRFAILVSRRGPIPEGLGGLALGVYRCMTGGAGDVVNMLVQVMVQQVLSVVRCLRVTVGAGYAAFHHGHRRTAPGNFVVARAVALRALEIETAHVDVAVALRLKELAREIGVLDGFAAAPVEMTIPTGFAGCAADAFGDRHQIHVGIGHAGGSWGFLVGAGAIMAHQAVDLGHIAKIKRCVFPSIAGVTTGATSLVADDADSEVVRSNGGFTELDLLSVIQGVW
jgi:hypothetical protein